MWLFQCIILLPKTTLWGGDLISDEFQIMSLQQFAHYTSVCSKGYVLSFNPHLLGFRQNFVGGYFRGTRNVE